MTDPADTFTYEELATALHAIGHGQLLLDRAVAWIVEHREPVCEPGQIYQDAEGLRFLRRDSVDWPWCLISSPLYKPGESDGRYFVESAAVRPLLKLVPDAWTPGNG